MKISVVGSRAFDDYKLLRETLDEYDIDLIVSGGATGADSLAERYAKEENINTMIFKPDWKTHGKAAGFIRNRDIVVNGNLVVAFWDGVSKGTLSSINIARKMNIETKIIRF